MSKKQKNTSSDTVPKFILTTANMLQKTSISLTVLFAKKLFTTPIKHKLPKREYEMEKHTNKELIMIPKINKKIMVYHYGTNPKKVLLVHGWSGRGTQLVKIADKLIELGYSTISFDAPAHGKSPGNTTLMPEFIASIITLNQNYGPFEYAIGHSLGGMSILNAIKDGLQIKKAVIIGSGDSVNDIVHDFISKLKLKPIIATRMRNSFEKKNNLDMESFSASIAAKQVKDIPTLIIHDKNDEDVPYSASQNIHKNLTGSKLILTEGLGHRKILGDKETINKIAEFLN
ncbi:MAG: alpha/beta hydrolase [Flavobacterium sp.]|nr:alpha/beta hydrolase [Flavobacterium sp.]